MVKSEIELDKSERAVGRPVEKQIRSAFILELMRLCDCSTMSELAIKTGIKRNTLDCWAFEDRSPVKGLEIALKLLVATKQDTGMDAGKAISNLIAMCE